MTVRITRVDEAHGRTVRVDGWLVAGDLTALEDEVGDGVRGTRLDLAHLRSADAAGIEALRGIEARGAELWRATPYVRLLLGAGTPSDE